MAYDATSATVEAKQARDRAREACVRVLPLAEAEAAVSDADSAAAAARSLAEPGCPIDAKAIRAAEGFAAEAREAAEMRRAYRPDVRTRRRFGNKGEGLV